MALPWSLRRARRKSSRGAELLGPASKKRKTTATAAADERRKKAKPTREVIEFFLSFKKEMMQKHKMTGQACWDLACKLAPEVYGHIHRHTHLRWKPCGGSGGKVGRKHRLSGAEVTDLLSFTHSLLHKGGAFTLGIFHEYVLQRLAPKKVSRTWCWKFLRGSGLRFAKVKGRERQKFTEAQVTELCHDLRMRLWYLKNLLMPLFLMGCFPGDFQEVKRPLRTQSVKRPIKVGKRPINEAKRPIKAKVLVGVSVGCLMGCFRAPQPWRKTAPLKWPIKRSMSIS